MIWSKYLARHYGFLLCITNLSLVLLMMLFELSYATLLVNSKNKGFLLACQLVLTSAPTLFLELVPLGSCLAMAILVARLAQRNEWITFAASGRSFLQMITPLLLTQLLFATISTGVLELSLPYASIKHSHLLYEDIGAERPNQGLPSQQQWQNEWPYLLKTDISLKSPGRYQNATLFEFDKNNYTLKKRYTIKELHITEDGYLNAKDIRIETMPIKTNDSHAATHYQVQTMQQATLPMRWPMVPDYKELHQEEPHALNLLELRKISNHPHLPFSWRFEYYQRLCLPLSLIVISIVSASLLIRIKRHVTLINTLLFGIVLLSSWIMLRYIGKQCALFWHWPMWLAVLLPHSVFVAVMLFRALRTHLAFTHQAR